MKTILLICFLIYSSICWGAIPPQKDLLVTTSLEGHKEIRSILVDGARVSENCRNKDCDALRAANIPKKAALAEEEDEETYCTQVGGQILKTQLPSKTSLDFCQFKDGSFISSWYLTN